VPCVRVCVAWIGPVCSGADRWRVDEEGIKGYRTLDVRVGIVHRNKIGVIGRRNSTVGLEGLVFLVRLYDCLSKCRRETGGRRVYS
jgi:hypothetical protein